MHYAELPKHVDEPLEDLDWLCGTKTLLGVRQLVVDLGRQTPPNRYRWQERAQCMLLWFEHMPPIKFLEKKWDGVSCANVSRMFELNVELETFIKRLPTPRVVEVRHEPRRFLDAADPFKMHEVENPGVLYLLDEQLDLVIAEVGTEPHDLLVFVSNWRLDGFTPSYLTPR